MATLTIRNLPDEVRDTLRIRAARNGRSMEAEVRAVLVGSVREPSPRRTAEERRALVRKIQRDVEHFIPRGSDSVEQFLAEKRAEVEAEADRWDRLEREAVQASDRRRG